MKTITRNNTHGFTLIEVMVAVVILAIGLLGLAKFQTELTKSASATKDRAAALALAEQKIEDLRSFARVSAPKDGSGNDILWDSTTNQTNSVVMAFDYIADNQGGRLDPLAQSEYVTGSGEQLTLTWTLQAAPIVGAKEVLVTVAWTDQKGQPQRVQLTEIISATDPGISSPVDGETGLTFDAPSIVYNPGIAPEVINIDVDTGDGLKKETSKPLPDVFHNGDYNKVTFDVVTYNSNNNNSVVRRETFINVNCLCTAGSGDSFTPAYTVFENDIQTIHDVEGFVVSKNTGVVVNNQQPAECVVCCRDRTDPATLPTDGAGASISYGDNHYTGSGNYAEACRLKYINGNLRVFQDWNLKTVTVFSDSYVSDSSPTSQQAYKDYVVAFAKNNNTTKATLTDRDITVTQGGNNQLQARPIYIDTVFNATNNAPTYVDFIASKIANGSDDTLQFIPFFEINLTKLANWTASDCTSPATGAANGACVTNEDIVDEGPTENNYSRGLVTAAAATASGATSTITASLNQGNSGVIGEATVGAPISDSLVATVSPAIATFDVSGQIGLCSITGADKNARKAALLSAVAGTGVVTYSGSSNGICVVTGNGANSRTLTCSGIPDPGTANITVNIATTGVIVSAALSNNSNITGPVTNVDAVICDE
ncbi:MAG: prepilin-type N-terminal cleavage/methylation domain-containing protein [Gammaproteobacteria bacterium]|nr:prepilin-type N-terminal cleavage/methylation domain-containing protein [Gammaproteobacteria bacterium]